VKIVHVTDLGAVATYGIMSIPGMMIRGNVASSGKALKENAIMKIFFWNFTEGH